MKTTAVGWVTAWIKVLVAAASVFAAGCAAPIKEPTADELKSADYGPPLTVQEANALIRERLERTLFDPTSYLYGGPAEVRKHWARNGSGKILYGYLAPYRVNAKNRYGAYVGEQVEAVFIVNKTIVQRFEYRAGGYWFPNLHEVWD
jgi:hypothetical protein